VDGGIAEVAHRVVEAVVGLDLVAVVADQVGRLLDVAERLEPILADLDRHQGPELHLALADQIRHAAHDRDPLQPRGPSPAGAAARAAAMASRTSARVPFANWPTSEPSIGERFSNVSLRRAPLAVDEDAVRAAELASGGQEAGVVGGVQLLVVVSQRGVGDLEPGLRRRGHPNALLVPGTLDLAAPPRAARPQQGTAI
jgi:hypothetical protein